MIRRNSSSYFLVIVFECSHFWILICSGNVGSYYTHSPTSPMVLVFLLLRIVLKSWNMAGLALKGRVLKHLILISILTAYIYKIQSCNMQQIQSWLLVVRLLLVYWIFMKIKFCNNYWLHSKDMIAWGCWNVLMLGFLRIQAQWGKI